MPRTALALALFLCSGIAAACICPPSNGTPEKAAEFGLFRSDVVAVMKIRDIRQEQASPDAEPVFVAEFEPIELFKGEKKAQPIYRAKVRKTTHDDRLRARVGMQWLVYIRGKQPLDFTRCSNSGPVDSMTGELAQLRRLAPH